MYAWLRRALPALVKQPLPALCGEYALVTIRSASVPLHELERDPLGAFEEAKPPADVIHLVIQHLHAVGDEVARNGGNIVDTKREVVAATSPPVGRMLTWIIRGARIELKQLDLETRLGAFERKRDVLRLHVRHAHVLRGRAAVDDRDVLFLETQQLEERKRALGVRHGDRDMIEIAHDHRRLPRLTR